jgi:hypothetical protein
MNESALLYSWRAQLISDHPIHATVIGCNQQLAAPQEIYPKLPFKITGANGFCGWRAGKLKIKALPLHPVAALLASSKCGCVFSMV